MPFRKFLPYLLIIAFFFVILLSVFYFSFFGKNPAPKKIKPKSSFSAPITFSPRPQDIDTQDLEYHPDSSTKAQTIDEASQEMLDKDAAIGQLLAKLPYQGNFFTLDYNYQVNSFTVNLSPDNPTQANLEFDQFLKSNRIENRNWLYNLKTTSL